LGGFPDYLAKTMTDSLAWDAISIALRKGAVVAGSSAGAMVFCEYYYTPSSEKVCKGLGLLPGVSVLPHHNTFGKKWSAHLLKLIPDTILIGIDEETGLIDDGSYEYWRVYGKGTVTLYRGKNIEQYNPGDNVSIAVGQQPKT
jgi:cyanophycinase